MLLYLAEFPQEAREELTAPGGAGLGTGDEISAVADETNALGGGGANPLKACLLGGPDAKPLELFMNSLWLRSEEEGRKEAPLPVPR